LHGLRRHQLFCSAKDYCSPVIGEHDEMSPHEKLKSTDHRIFEGTSRVSLLCLTGLLHLTLAHHDSRFAEHWSSPFIRPQAANGRSCDGRQDEDAGALYRDLFPFIMDSHTSPQGDNADPEALLQNRILSNQQVSRAAFYDHDDSLCAASSTSRFKLAPDDIRKVRPLLISQAMDWLINDLSIDPRWASDLRRLQVELGSLRST